MTLFTIVDMMLSSKSIDRAASLCPEYYPEYYQLQPYRILPLGT